MKKILLLLAIILVVSCKKDNPVEPVVNNYGKVLFHEYFQKGTLTVYIDDKLVGSTNLFPVKFPIDCDTSKIGCVEFKAESGVYNYRATIDSASIHKEKTGVIQITDGSCKTIKI